MVLYGDALSHRFTKLGNRDFVSKLAEIIDLFKVFSTFDMDKLGKILPHHWKERLNIGKIAKFESDTF